MRRVHVIIRGDVQGVGYRYTARVIAADIGATGWIRNLHDGSVEAEMQGSPVQVDEMLAWMAGGPPGSRVDAAVVSERSVAAIERGFEVRFDG